MGLKLDNKDSYEIKIKQLIFFKQKTDYRKTIEPKNFFSPINWAFGKKFWLRLYV